MAEPALATTATLIRRVQAGESHARDLLAERCLPLLQRWARGRLPVYGRDLAETDDIVQLTMIKGLAKVERFQHHRQGAFLAYMRQILLNTVRDEIRRTKASTKGGSLDDEPADHGSPSIDQQVVNRETLEDYEHALGELADPQRTAVILRVEFGMTFPEVAAELELSSANTARMMVRRGLQKLAGLMR